MADDQPPKTVKMPCIDCGGWPKNHHVLHEVCREWNDDDGSLAAFVNYQICRCLGCDRISFREASSSYEDVDDEGNHPERVVTYPDLSRSEYKPMSTKELPDTVARIYLETISALNAGAVTLAGGGLRAIVEGICIDQQVQGRNLQDKIDNLAVKGLLAKPQAELLHEERYIGNFALHELHPPSKQELKDGLKIIEGLMTTIYVLPKHAAKLKAERLKRGGP